ncbi:MAG: PEP-CTERM sorting domain-containing protein [Proteobacteria bacterium]|nr:PEP-CTERM sorting domain-containing protein [Pseudomonadota bacterium]
MSNLLINNAANPTAKATTSAALQLAAWEIVNENTNSYGFNTGTFRSSGGNSDAARTLAMTYLNNITSGSWQAPTGQLKLFYSAHSQSQVLSAVPEPATWAMMIGGFGVVGASMRRKRAAGTVVTA